MRTSAMTPQNRRKRVIEAWIDKKWSKREHWLDAGLLAFELALPLKQKHASGTTLALAYSLESGESRRGVNFYSPHELEAQFNWSPPSLYLFHGGAEPWIKGHVDILDASTKFGESYSARKCYFFEFKADGEAEYLRSVFMSE
jgi:hypothetical protein